MLIYLITTYILIVKIIQQDYIWLISRRAAFLKIYVLPLLLIEIKPTLLLMIFFIDLILFHTKYRIELILRLYIAFIFFFLTKSLVPLVFLLNPVILADAFRVVMGTDPETIARGGSIIVKMYKDLPPVGKGMFALTGMATMSGMTYVGYHDYCHLQEFNSAYDCWVENQRVLQKQLLNQQQYGEQDFKLVKQCQLQDIDTRLNCLKIKQKFFFHPIYHPELNFTPLLNRSPLDAVGLGFKKLQ